MVVSAGTGAGSVAARTVDPGGRRVVDHTARTRSRVGVGTAGWRTRVLVPVSRSVGTSALAVSESGDAAVAWVQGKPPPVCFGCTAFDARAGLRIMVRRGTVVGGFGKPRELAADSGGGVFVAEL